jgi:hypothetical protein
MAVVLTRPHHYHLYQARLPADGQDEREGDLGAQTSR